MRVLLSIVVFLAVSSAFPHLPLEKWEQELAEKFHEDVLLFKKWRASFDRFYHSVSEAIKRFHVFRENIRFILAHNAEPNQSFLLGETPFTDLTAEEWAATGVNVTDHSKAVDTAVHLHTLDGDAEVDWRDHGIVTSVKNQGLCGSCWTFSAAAVTEGAWALKTGQLMSLSSQQLLDCNDENDKCSGGTQPAVFDYIKKNGLAPDADYPYLDVRGYHRSTCTYNASDSVATIANYSQVPVDDEEALVKAIANYGPVSVAIQSNLPTLQHFKSGLYNDYRCTYEQMDHLVTAVGYGTDESGQDYYLVKNSWGAQWGENGFVRMVRHKNMCGIAHSAVFAQA